MSSSAYIDLVGLIKQGALSPKGIIMATYALCGFANFSSIAIQIGGISPMAPHRKKDIAAFGPEGGPGRLAGHADDAPPWPGSCWVEVGVASPLSTFCR